MGLKGAVQGSGAEPGRQGPRLRFILARRKNKRNFMPFYEYQCKSCGHTLEAMQKINDSPLRKCPHCGKSQLTRLMSAPVFRLKGGGWYETDFKGDQDNKKNLADRPEVEAPKEETKPAADGKAAEPKAADGKAADTGAKEAAKPAEKAGDKPTPKAPAETPKKAASGGMSRRGATAAPPKARAATPAKKAVKKPVRKAASKLKRRG
jgi:putative FmdB family regulatory protein